jgi:hypothetical protein
LFKNVKKIALITVLILVTLPVVDPIAAQEPGDRSAEEVSEDPGKTVLKNASTVVVGPPGEEIEGDPDQPIVTGRVVNPDVTPEPTGLDDDEFGKTITQGSPTPSPEPTGIEHEDIGIAEPEPTGIDDDEFGKTLTQGSLTPAPGAPEIDDEVIVAFEQGDTEEGSGYNEFTMDDTKGKEESEGEVRFGDGIRGARPAEESESYEVVVRGWDYKKKEAVQTQYGQTDLDFILKRASRNVEELEEYSEALTQSDPNIEKIVLTESTVELDYRFPAKLLGILNLEYTYQAEVDKLGRVKVKLPWWLFLTRNNADDVSLELEENLSTEGDDAQMANIDLQNTLQKQQQTLQTLSNVMKTHHDKAMAVIRKIG